MSVERDSELQPFSQAAIQRLLVVWGDGSDHFNHEPFFNGRELRLNPGRDIQPCRVPILEREIRVG